MVLQCIANFYKSFKKKQEIVSKLVIFKQTKNKCQSARQMQWCSPEHILQELYKSEYRRNWMAYIPLYKCDTGTFQNQQYGCGLADPTLNYPA